MRCLRRIRRRPSSGRKKSFRKKSRGSRRSQPRPSYSLENPARLSKAGVTLVLSSFDTHNARNLRQEAGNAISNGLDRDAALRAVTLEPARVWGVADRVGSLEVGKDADLVVWSGDPFELTTGAEHVFIAGHEMSRDTRQKQLFEKYRVIR